ncbi:MAG: hypothetical protein ACPLXL_01635, partial [Minisyncoccia bacterium]
ESIIDETIYHIDFFHIDFLDLSPIVGRPPENSWLARIEDPSTALFAKRRFNFLWEAAKKL